MYIIHDLKELTILSAVLLILLLIAMGFANSLERKADASERFFQRFDTDNDNRVSREEFSGPEDHFSNLDEDADGYIEKSELSETEFKRASENPIEPFDKDGDGLLSWAEFPGSRDHFTQFDTNNDGFIEEAEMPDIPPQQRVGK